MGMRTRSALAKRSIGLAIAATLAVASGLAVSQVPADPARALESRLRDRIWTSLKDYTFQDKSDAIIVSDMSKAREIAEYLVRNPSFLIGLDGWSARRVFVVRDALLDAGVPEERILLGAYGYWQMRREGLVMVMVAK